MAGLFVILEEIQTQAERFMGKRSAYGNKRSYCDPVSAKLQLVL
jgi:hypothetical protein